MQTTDNTTYNADRTRAMSGPRGREDEQRQDTTWPQTSTRGRWPTNPAQRRPGGPRGSSRPTTRGDRRAWRACARTQLAPEKKHSREAANSAGRFRRPNTRIGNGPLEFDRCLLTGQSAEAGPIQVSPADHSVRYELQTMFKTIAAAVREARRGPPKSLRPRSLQDTIQKKLANAPN